MENNLVIPEAQEAQEFAQLNIYAETNLAARKYVQDSRTAANRKRYNLRTACEICGLCALGAAVAVGGSASLIHPVIVIPVVLSSMCLSFLRFGVWIGKVVKR